MGRASIETYQKLDRHVRRAVCKIPHSPVNFSKEWIHLSIRLGGLEIPNVTEVTYLAKVWLVFDQLLTLVFGELRSLFSNGTWRVPEASIPAHGALLSINFGGEMGQVHSRRGAEASTGRLNCRWLHDGLCDRRRCGGAFIFASMLRTLTLSCFESLVRGREKSIPSCRACREGAETITHFFQNCRSMTHMRIRRHMVIDVVKKRLRKEGYVVLNEPRVLSHEKDQVLRPDLCAKKDGKTMVLDAHVRMRPRQRDQPSLEVIRSRNMLHTATASGAVWVVMT